MTLEILKRYSIKAKKSLGQNFLVNDNILEKISSFLNIKNENIIEIGPGYGALTQKLLEKKPKSLTLIELDQEMINILQDRINIGELNISGINFNIIKKDVLKYEPDFQENYSVIANIPYYITSPILRHFLYNTKNKPEKMLILMQKDVGDKILGSNKNKSSVLSLLVDKKANVKEILFVGKENFIPKPKVESSVLYFEKHNLYQEIDDEIFLKSIKIGFSSVRKKLLNNFIIGGYKKEDILKILSKLNLKEDIRGEDLDIENWCKLVEKIKDIK